MRALGFGAEWVEDGVLQVWPPSWRHDVTMEADVVEELVRLHGYDRVPPMPVRRTEAVGHPALSPEQRQRALRAPRAGRARPRRGGHLVVRRAGAGAAVRRRRACGCATRSTPSSSVLRPSVLPNLLSAAVRNQSRGSGPDLGLFEVGRALLRRPAGRAGDGRRRPPGRPEPRAPLGRGAAAGRRVRRRAPTPRRCSRLQGQATTRYGWSPRVRRTITRAGAAA